MVLWKEALENEKDLNNYNTFKNKDYVVSYRLIETQTKLYSLQINKK
jgi:hypothetical protein